MTMNRALILVLMATILLTALPGISMGQGLKYGMDTKASELDASFIGGSDRELSVSIAGDVNGDGFDDILIGVAIWSDYDINVYLFFGKASGWGKNMSLSEADASFIINEQLGDYYEGAAKVSVTGAGDVNGDGFDDILIGADAQFHVDDGVCIDCHASLSRTFLILGRPSGWEMNMNLSKEADASFLPEVAYELPPVASAGDVNRDGYDDILIGDFYSDKVFLIFGKASGWSMNTPLSNAVTSFLIAGYDYATIISSFTSAGDVNGDRYDDILFNVNHFPTRYSSFSETYLILGKASGWEKEINLVYANASFIGSGPSEYEYSLLSVGAGDVNGDGYDDILIGGSTTDIAFNGTYLILGKASGWAMHTNLTNADASFIHPEAESESGPMNDVTYIGDINDDGFDDIVIAGDGPSVETYIILGKAFGWEIDTNLTNSNASFLWMNESPMFRVVFGGGDINGDGCDDILINTYYNFTEDDTGFLEWFNWSVYLILPSNGTPNYMSGSRTVSVGPIKDPEGNVITNATVEISTCGRVWRGETDVDGLADIEVPVTILGRAVDISVIKDGYEETTFRCTVGKDGTLAPVNVKYPYLEKKGDKPDNTNDKPDARHNSSVISTMAGGTIIGAIVALGAFLGWTEVGKFGLLSFMMPLYTRINKECVLDNFTRGMVYGHIRENPGIYFTELMNMAEVSAGALTYHLKALEREGLILSRSQGFHRALFPASMKVSKWELILNKTEMLVFNIIRSNPGISQQKIAKKTALNKMSVSRLVKSLEEKEFITVERGKFNRCRVREDKMVLDGQGSGTSAYSALDR